MLIPLFLYEKEILSQPMFYLSVYLERNRQQYYQALNAISEKDDWSGWINFFLTAVTEQARENTRKARAILDLYEEMKQKVPGITRSQYAIQAIDALFNQPLFTTADFSNRSGIPMATAKRILNSFEKGNIIRVFQKRKGSKGIRFIFQPLISIVNIQEEPAHV